MRFEEIFDLKRSIAGDHIARSSKIGDVISSIKDITVMLSERLGEEYSEISHGVFAARGAKISEKATVMPPAIIGRCEIRPGAYIRGGVIVGEDAVIGNSTEIKNSIIFDCVQLPHYNYVGDSIIGHKAHLGAGAIISNFRLDRKNVTIRHKDNRLSTGLRKFGALIGDFCEIGCNSVICPGSILGRGTVAYPLSSINGITNINFDIEEGDI